VSAAVASLAQTAARAVALFAIDAPRAGSARSRNDRASSMGRCPRRAVRGVRRSGRWAATRRFLDERRRIDRGRRDAHRPARRRSVFVARRQRARSGVGGMHAPLVAPRLELQLRPNARRPGRLHEQRLLDLGASQRGHLLRFLRDGLCEQRQDRRRRQPGHLQRDDQRPPLRRHRHQRLRHHCRIEGQGLYVRQWWRRLEFGGPRRRRLLLLPSSTPRGAPPPPTSRCGNHNRRRGKRCTDRWST
jgi:hypothetical protein